MNCCENCGGDIADDQLHTAQECFNHLHAMIDDLEEENRALEDVNKAYRRQIAKLSRRKGDASTPTLLL